MLLGQRAGSVQRIIRTGEQLVAFTASQAYAAKDGTGEFKFEEVPLLRNASGEGIPLVRLFLNLHSGAIWGLPGRLLIDAAGLLVIFLGGSACYTWYFPRVARKRKKSGSSVSSRARYLFRLLRKYHLRLGIWSAVLLLLIAVTGFFLRPPPIVLLMGKSIPKAWYPGHHADTPWHGAIRNAVYERTGNTILIEAEGFWRGPADFSGPFVPAELPIPVFAMGTTVFDCTKDDDLVVGSFGGLFRWDRDSGKVFDVLNGGESSARTIGRPGNFMVTGYFVTPEGEAFAAGHKKGLMPVGDAELRGRFEMPGQMEARYRMPLWNFMFELHNGRIFRDFIGPMYIFVPLLGALLFVVVLMSGVYDWVFRKLRT